MAHFFRILTVMSVCAITLALSSTDMHALNLPSAAILTAEHTEKATEQRFPTSVFKETGTQFSTVPGTLSQYAYKLPSSSLTTLQLLVPLQEQLEQSGFRSTFSCADSVCGGFDFRFLLELLPEPAMHVDLGNFQYTFAQHADGRATAIITSRSRSTGFIHITSITPPNGYASSVSASVIQNIQTPKDVRASNRLPTSITTILQNSGSIVLDDLVFASGSSSLTDETFTSLSEVAAFLAQDTSRRLALVGHTDAVGSLAGNMSLSHKRADSVRNRLITNYNVPAAQLTAEGIGYLAPRASNTTAQGREKNRRVEAVVTSIP